MISKKLLRAAAFGAFAVVATASVALAQTSAPADTPPAPALPATTTPAAPPSASAPADASTPTTAPAPPPAAAIVPPSGPQQLSRSAFASTNLNLRSGPGTDNAILGTIPAGSVVRVTTCTGEWCAVQWNGRDGYAIARNLGSTKPRLARRYVARPYYEPGPAVVYGPPAYYYGGPIYRPYYYYRPRLYYRRGWGWYRRW